MHSGQGLTPENSMRTAALALNAQSRQKLNLTHADAGTLYIDESSQLQGELNNAAALRTTYSRKATYNLNDKIYSHPLERFGRIAFLIYSQEGETSNFLSAQHRNPGESCFQAATGSSFKVAAVAASQDQSHESTFAQSQFKAGGKSIESRFQGGPNRFKVWIWRSQSKPCK